MEDNRLVQLGYENPAKVVASQELDEAGNRHLNEILSEANIVTFFKKFIEDLKRGETDSSDFHLAYSAFIKSDGLFLVATNPEFSRCAGERATTTSPAI